MKWPIGQEKYICRDLGIIIFATKQAVAAAVGLGFGSYYIYLWDQLFTPQVLFSGNFLNLHHGFDRVIDLFSFVYNISS